MTFAERRLTDGRTDVAMGDKSGCHGGSGHQWRPPAARSDTAVAATRRRIDFRRLRAVGTDREAETVVGRLVGHVRR